MKKQALSNCSFENLLLEAVDEGLSSLCDSAKEAVYFHLNKTFRIKKRDIPHKIKEFDDAVEKMFGVGAKTLETLIMKRLYEKVGGIVKYNKEQKNLIFTEYITSVRQTFEEKRTL